MAERRLNRGWLAVAALLVAAAPAWWGWVGSAPELPSDAVRSVAPAAPILAVPPAAALQFLASEAPAARSREPAESGIAATADPVGSASDLKRVFDDYIDRRDPRQRRTAVRAFEACVPAFLPAAGQSPSPEPLIAALPPDHRTEREAAYRSLFARCHRLLAGDRVALGATLGTVQSDPQSQPPERIAADSALAGRLDRVDTMVSEALNGADPAAVASLAGLAPRIVRAGEPDADSQLLQRAQEIDAALPLVACDLGLDCSAQSLWALQLCAAEALCEGDLPARLSARSPRVDGGAVEKQRSRLLGLIHGGHTLGMADLLPK